MRYEQLRLVSRISDQGESVVIVLTTGTPKVGLEVTRSEFRCGAAHAELSMPSTPVKAEARSAPTTPRAAAVGGASAARLAAMYDAPG